MKPLLVSACLVGEPCRYNLGDVSHPDLVKLAKQGKVLAVCPEMLGGLAAPRQPCEIKDGRVLAKDGTDLTQAFATGAEKALEMALEAGCDRAVLKSGSPSCGLGRIYDGSFSGVLVPGDGVFAALLKTRGFTVATELDL